jgi:hypothetical protein
VPIPRVAARHTAGRSLAKGHSARPKAAKLYVSERQTCSASFSTEQTSIAGLLDHLSLDGGQRECLWQHASCTASACQSAEDNLRVLLKTYSRARVKHLLTRNPTLPCCATPFTNSLEFLTAYGFSASEVYTVVESTGSHWHDFRIFSAGQLFMFLQAYGLTPVSIQHLVSHHPQVLLLQYDHLKNLGARLSELGCTPTQVSSLFLHHPRVLSCSVPTDIDAKLPLLRAFGVTDSAFRTFIPACVHQFIAEPRDSMAAKLQYMSSVGIDAAALQHLLAACPAMWPLAVTDIMDKWNFLTRVMGLGLPDVLQYPRFFEKDLMCCIRPRFLLLEQLSDASAGGSAAAVGRHQTSRSLSWLLDCTDAEFRARAGVSMAAYLEFYNALVAGQYYGVKAAVDVHDRPEPCKGR